MSCRNYSRLFVISYVPSRADQYNHSVHDFLKTVHDFMTLYGKANIITVGLIKGKQLYCGMLEFRFDD